MLNSPLTDSIPTVNGPIGPARVGIRRSSCNCFIPGKIKHASQQWAPRQAGSKQVKASLYYYNLVQPPPRTSPDDDTVPRPKYVLDSGMLCYCAGARRSMSHSNNPHHLRSTHHKIERLSWKRFKAGAFAPSASDNWTSSTRSD